MFGIATRLFGYLSIALMASFSVAQSDAEDTAEFPATAHTTVELISDELIAMLGNASQRFNEDAEGFYSDIDSVLSPWIDFGEWTRGVMGEYFQQASEDQVQAFADTFRASLVETYAKGLINVEDADYEIVPPKEGDEQETRVAVGQRLFSGSEEIRVVYDMIKNGEGRWQVRNAVLDGVRLGPVFRSQFKGAMEDNDDDIDLVIQSWGQ